MSLLDQMNSAQFNHFVFTECGGLDKYKEMLKECMEEFLKNHLDEISDNLVAKVRRGNIRVVKTEGKTNDLH